MQAASLTEQAYVRIQDEILSGTLPMGRKVSEVSLAKRLALGRAPVREALRQLQSDGVVQQIPRFGTVIRALRRRDVIDLYELREGLESYAAGKAARRIRPEQVERLRQFLREMRDAARGLKHSGQTHLEPDAAQAHLAADMAFHAVLVSASGNAQIAETVRRRRLLGRIVATHVLRFDLPMLVRTYRIHRRILRAVEQGDAAAARRAMARHIRLGLRRMLQQFDRYQAERERDEVDLLAELGAMAAANELAGYGAGLFLDRRDGKPATDGMEDA